METSPLTRGKPHPFEAAVHVLGNIPAHAGKTGRGKRTQPNCRKHPRSRGENRNACKGYGMVTETSPLTRGKLKLRLASTKNSRNIPAHAGKTYGFRSDYTFRRKHPRSRGENRVKKPRHALYVETSPLTRGKLGVGVGDSADDRNIPAHAGKTLGGHKVLAKAWKHPRSRGENCLLGWLTLRSTETSPLTRGKQALSAMRWKS